MTKTISLIFPNQLFHGVPISIYSENIILIEDSLYFGEKKYIHNFHKNKLVLLRASMKNYFDEKLNNFNSKYVEYEEGNLEETFKKLKSVEKIFVYEPKDFLLEKRLKKCSKKHNIELEIIENPGFLTPKKIYNEYFNNHKYFMTPFYIEQRKRLNILVKKDGKALHDKWTFDTDNREKLPKNLEVPLPKFFGHNDYVTEAKKYVEKHFTNNIGETENFIYPISHTEAKRALHNFIEERLNDFGPYEDAISQKNDFNFHSLLSSSINLGLLTPQEVLDETLKFSENNKIHFASLEGFIRQIIGWREFMMIVYERDGVKERTSNYFHHKRKLPKSFYDGTIGIKPVDDTIKKALKYGYTHHIERLMILGNFMCLCEIDPDEIYKWFMEFYIDAYDWVMVPNVYGMSQFADGGLITTKPYVSSSNYILKMSDYSKNEEWCEIWDGLFWRFLHKNKAKIASNSRIGMLLKANDISKYEDKIKKAEKFLKDLV